MEWQIEGMNYHYTTILHLPYILMSDVLQASRRNAHGDHREGLLWFSTNRTMEKTASKGDVAMVRFSSLDPRVGGWRLLGREIGYSSGVIRRLEKSGRKMGAAPNEWLAMTGNLELSNVETIELQGARGWQRLDRGTLRVERLEGGSVRLLGPSGVAAMIGRKKTAEGYYAYATNSATYRPGSLLPAVETLRRTG